MLHWSIFLAGVAFTAIASTQASIIEKWENPDLDQGIAEQDHKNVKFAGGYSSGFPGFPGFKYTCPCGYVNGGIRAAGRIINGTEVQQESKYPFLVGLRNYNMDRTGRFMCGGSILTRLHILTAAHCISNYTTKMIPDVSRLEVIVGLHWWSQDQTLGGSYRQTQKFNVAEAHIPREWYDSGRGVARGDVAVLVLEAPIIFSQWVGPVCLTPVMPPIAKEYIKVMGWGEFQPGITSETLRETDLLAMGQHCPDNPREVCLARYGTTTGGGDSGGPFVYLDRETNRYTQVSLLTGLRPIGATHVTFGPRLELYYRFIQDVVAGTPGGYGICQKIN